MHGTKDLVQYNAVTSRQRMLDINPNININIYPVAFTAENALDISSDY